ncbi:MAG: translation initiation factor IF-2 [Deltaproteobacteria bacterium]|nr:MAG: translation initiation factor IF-2 [Deltaproteobacteria bacterium]
MSKMRVYEIAKEVGLESKALVEKLKEMGYEVRSHASSLDADVANNIIEKLKAEKNERVVEQRVSSGVIRRRARVVRRPAEQPPAAAEKSPEETEAVREAGAEPRPQQQQQQQPQPEQRPAASQEPAEKLEEEEKARPEKPRQPEQAEKEAAAKENLEEAEKPQDASRKPAKKKEDDFYRAKVVRRIDSRTLAKSISEKKETAPKESKGGVRILKVVPGREGRGHEFIDVSKRDKSRDKAEASRKKSRYDLREQLFDVYGGVSSYVPSAPRKRRIARRGAKKTQVTTPKAQKRVIKLESKTVLASELAKRMGIKLIELNRKLVELGGELENLRDDAELDLDTATLVAQEFDYQIKDASFKEEEVLEAVAQEHEQEGEPRPPVVTVMGHVDHGKTSILDAIRKSKVTESEAGGITQHIGAYEVHLPQGSITFIDTPGHEAFTAMRARGARVTDVVVLVVAADDGIMPQTVEAINHSREAGVPIIVAINKIDIPGVKTEVIRQKLTEYELVPEEWGGDTQVVEVSAKTKQGLDELLEAILLQAEMLELKARVKGPAKGSVLEARLDKGRGPVATLLVQEGTLRTGDVVVVGTAFGRIRALLDFEGKRVDAAAPGKPVQVQGLSEVPAAGEQFHVVKNEREAKQVVQHRIEEAKRARQGETARLNLDDFYQKLQGLQKPELKLIIKADVQGTAEAVKQAVEKLDTPKVGIKVIHYGVGGITETDVNLAAASGAVVVGFNVRPDPNAKRLAQTSKVDVRFYNVIYDLIQQIRDLQVGLLPATKKETTIGRAEVRELFNIPKIGVVAGAAVVDGKIVRGAMARLLRDSVEVYQGRISSLRRFKEDVREVASGYECGIGIENFNDIRKGDIIETFVVEEERPTL